MELHIPFMNFLPIFKLLQIRLPFTETVFYAPMSTFLPYPITHRLQRAPPGAPLDACVRRSACRRGRGSLQPLVRSRPADRRQQKPESLAFQKSLLLAPLTQATTTCHILLVGKRGNNHGCLLSLPALPALLPAPAIPHCPVLLPASPSSIPRV